MTTGATYNTTIDNSTSLEPEKEETKSNNRKENDYDNGETKTETMKQKTKDAPSRIQCPCHNYTALSKIVDVISSEDRSRTDSMIEWLNGDTDKIAVRQKKLLTCGKRFKCRYRYGTSFAILRAIRDACAPFQTASTTIGDSASANPPKENMRSDLVPSNFETSNKQQISESTSYDQSFPPLSQHPGISNILIPPSGKSHDVSKKASAATPIVNTLKARKKKPKRRVQPQLTEASKSTFPSPLSGDAPIPKESDPPSKSDGDKTHYTETNKKDTRVPASISGASKVVNTLEHAKIKPKRVQPQLIAVTSPSSSCSSSLARDSPKPGTKSNFEIGAIDKTIFSDQSTGEKSVVKTPTKSSKEVIEATIDQMDRLVDIYIALMKNMLVPSTPLEIHFLLEMLLMDTDSSRSSLRERSQRNLLKQTHKSKDENEQASVTGSVLSVSGSVLFFQPIFYSPERCIEFAQGVMTRFLEGGIKRMSPFLVKTLLGDRVFVRRCPIVAEHLNNHLLQTTSAIEWIPPTSESITGTHAIFSLPFEADRDSRHNFKTQSEIAMYQNRELTRDAFLSQLRVFITAKSKVFLPREVDKVRETAQYESRKIIGNILPHNMVWFAQFFCELLLQVGLVPVEEMDQELLQIVADDRDKLRKLHKRFFKKNPSRPSQSRAGFGTSTTTGHRNERYRNSNDGNRNEIKSSTITAFQEALPYFPGYQEFFFIFLYSVDSYNFGMHLLHQVVKKTSDMISNHSLPGLEKRTLDLGLLARFLGCLIFSPNWHEDTVDLNKLKPCIHSLDHGLDLLEALGLPISKIVKESWDGGYTFLVIPWVTELLKMSKWDSVSQSSMNFRHILANLRYIQCIASGSSPEKCAACASNMQQVFFHLETFFNESFSLPKLTSLPNATLVPQFHENEHSLDNYKIRLSKAAIYASGPHMEDLCDMIMISKKEMRRDMTNPSSKPKKLKPSMVSAIVDSEARSYLGVESPNGKVVPTLSNSNQKEPLVDNSIHGKKMHAKNKLVEGFFHQHRHLKEICDFAVQQTLKGLSVDEIRPFVMNASDEFPIGTQSTESEIEEMQSRAFEQSQEYLRNKLVNTLSKSLQLFSGTDTDQRVIDIATNISADRGMEASHVIVRDLISSSTKNLLKQLEDTTTALNHKCEESKVNVDRVTESATMSIRNLTEKYSTVSDDYVNTKYVEEALCRVELVTNSVLIPRENVLRDFFESILGLDQIAELVIGKVTKSCTPESWATLCSFFRLLKQLALISGYLRNRIHTLFGDDLVNLIANCEVPSSSEKEKILERISHSSVVRKMSSIAFGSDKEKSNYEGIIDPKTINFH